MEPRNLLVLPIDHSPEHASALGRLLVHWGILERLLIDLLRYLLPSDLHKSRLIYQEFTNIRAKIKLLKRLNQYHYHDKITKNKIETLLTQVANLIKDRNDFIHSIWGNISAMSLERTRTINPSNHKIFENPVEKFTPQDIQKVVNNIAEVSLSLWTLLDQVFGFAPKSP